MENIAWMAWTLPTAIFFVLLALTLVVHDLACDLPARGAAQGDSRIPTTRGDRLFISLIGCRVHMHPVDRASAAESSGTRSAI